MAGELVALERRILFDGAAVATGAEVLVDHMPQSEAEAPLESANPPAPIAENQPNLTAVLHALTGEPTGSERREIVFIDTTVDDYQILMEGIDPNVTGRPGIARRNQPRKHHQ